MNPRGGVDGAHFVAGAAIADATQRLDIHHPGLGKNPRSVLFREIQIGQVQGILRAIPATYHAASAADAGGSRRAFSPKKWIRKGLIAGLSLRRLEDAHFGAVEGMPRARSFRRFLQEMVGGSEDSVLGYTQHFLRRFDSAAASPLSN